MHSAATTVSLCVLCRDEPDVVARPTALNHSTKSSSALLEPFYRALRPPLMGELIYAHVGLFGTPAATQASRFVVERRSSGRDIDAQLLHANVRHLYTTAALDPGVHPPAGREGDRGESGPQDADAGERRATVHHQVLKIRPDVLMYPPDRVKSGAPRVNRQWGRHG